MHDTELKIKLGGQEWILSFNNYAMAEIGNVFGLDPLEANIKLASAIKDNYMSVMPVIIFSGIVGACLSEGNMEYPVTKKEIFKMIGDVQDAEEITGITSALQKYIHCVQEKNKITPVAKKKDKK